MRSIEDKGCYNFGTATIDNTTSSFQQNGINRGAAPQPHHHHRSVPLGKPTPSKWDDAQKWLVGTLSRGGDPKTKPRNSNADDTRLIAPPVPQKEEEDDLDLDIHLQVVETKKVDNCDNESSSVWRVNKHSNNNSSSVVRSICVRDMGTEMTPNASLEPSRTATPIRSTTPANLSPMASGTSSPVRGGAHTIDQSRGDNDVLSKVAEGGDNLEQGVRKLSPLETRAVAWDEAERAKYTARYKREEVRIEAWENHQKRKAEMEIKRMEVKAERLKTRSQEKLANKLAAITRVAEEKRTNAEAELNEKAVRTSERADYIRRTGRLPSSFSFKLPSLCCRW